LGEIGGREAAFEDSEKAVALVGEPAALLHDLPFRWMEPSIFAQLYVNTLHKFTEAGQADHSRDAGAANENCVALLL
jgi:hypothetical protein